MKVLSPAQEKLQNWYNEEKNGMFDFKIFPFGGETPEKLAEDVLKLVDLWKSGAGRLITSDQDFNK